MHSIFPIQDEKNMPAQHAVFAAISRNPAIDATTQTRTHVAFPLNVAFALLFHAVHKDGMREFLFPLASSFGLCLSLRARDAVAAAADR
ncbi:MAG TPA: hypothetical protein VKB38_24595 [Terracidiphilus sp.]|nr:hypothetical protein [Terracidiphilus sp.]